METTQEQYLNNVIEWVTLVKGQDYLLSNLDTFEGIQILMQEYNSAYQNFVGKVLDLTKNHYEVVSHGLMMNTYYSIKQRVLTDQRTKSINCLKTSLI